MSINALTKIAPTWYTPESEKDSDDPTRFKIRPLTPPERESVTELDDDGSFNIPPKNFGQVLRLGVVDWENFNDAETGKPIKFSYTNHWRIPWEIRLELAGQILISSQLSGDEEKNS